MKKMTCPSCYCSTGVKADGTWVAHTVNGMLIRAGAKLDGRKCRKSGKRVKTVAAR